MKNNKIVLTYYYTGIDDVWHYHKHKDKDIHDFDTLWDSVEGRGYDFVTLANELHPDTKRSGSWKVVALDNKNYPPLCKPKDMSLYVFKFIACYRYLLNHPEYEEIWIVDSSDTEMLSTPKPEEGKIYTGYDAFIPAFDRYCNFDWSLGAIKYGLSIPRHFGVGMRHGPMEETFLRNAHHEDIPYNCGIFGGKRTIVMEFLKKYVERLEKNDIDLEMVPFNFLIYTEYPDVTENCATRMTLTEKDYNKWWRHK